MSGEWCGYAPNNQENIGFSEADIFRLARTRTAHRRFSPLQAENNKEQRTEKTKYGTKQAQTIRESDKLWLCLQQQAKNPHTIIISR